MSNETPETQNPAAEAAPDPSPAPEPAPEAPVEATTEATVEPPPDTTGIGGTDIHMPEPTPAATQPAAASPSSASAPPKGNSDSQFLMICAGITFFVVILGISIGGVRHFFPGLFANRTDAEIAADYEAARGIKPKGDLAKATKTPAAPTSTASYVPPAPTTSSPPALPPAIEAPLHSTPDADSIEKLKAELAAERAAATEARARVKELERALAALRKQLDGERSRREDAEIRSDDKRALDLYQQATEAAEKKNFAKAKVLAEGVIRLSPDHVGARALRARSALETGDPQAAFSDYLAAIRLDPRFAPHHRGMGRALLAMGRPKEAIAAVERALSIDPGDLKAIELRDAAAKQLKQTGGK